MGGRQRGGVLGRTAVLAKDLRHGRGAVSAGCLRPGAGGLIFGYATVSERAIAEGIARLAGVVNEL